METPFSLKYHAKIIESPCPDKIQDGMCAQGINFGFGDSKYRCYIILTDKNQDHIIIHLLLIWAEVLNDDLSGVKVWRKGDVYRDISIAFHNARRNPNNIKVYLVNHTIKSIEIAYNYSTLGLISIELH